MLVTEEVEEVSYTVANLELTWLHALMNFYSISTPIAIQAN